MRPMTRTSPTPIRNLSAISAFFPLGVDQPEHLTAEQVQQYKRRRAVFPIACSRSRNRVDRSYFDDLLPRHLRG